MPTYAMLTDEGKIIPLDAPLMTKDIDLMYPKLMRELKALPRRTRLGNYVTVIRAAGITCDYCVTALLLKIVEPCQHK